MMGGLAAYTEGDSFDPDKALEYKEKAMAELEGQVTFPIQILVPFSTAKVDTANRMQVMEQQLEKLLGTDYINIVLESHPSTGFTKQVRTPGAYSMMEMGWGPDFADPLGMMIRYIQVLWMASICVSAWRKIFRMKMAAVSLKRL